MNDINDYYSFVDHYNLEVLKTKIQFENQIKKLLALIPENELEDMTTPLRLEQAILNLTSSMDKGIVPISSGYYFDDQGRKIETCFPDVRGYADKEFDYFQKRYDDCKNVSLKVRYGMFLLVSKKLNKHNEKRELVVLIEKLVQAFWEEMNQQAEHKNTYLHAMFKVWEDGLKILIREGDHLSNDFDYYLDEMQKKHSDFEGSLKEKINFSSRYIHCLTPEVKKLKSRIASNDILNHIQGLLDQNDEFESYDEIKLLELCIETSQAFQVGSKEFFQRACSLEYERAGDADGSEGKWHHAVRHYEDALKNLISFKDDEDKERIEKKLQNNKGKFQMETISKELPPDFADHISKKVDTIFANSNPTEIFQFLCGDFILPSYEQIVIEAATNKAQDSFLNEIQIHSFDSRNNVSRIYKTAEDMDVYHQFHVLGFSTQFAYQIIFTFIYRGVTKEKVLNEDYLSALFSNSWMKEPIVEDDEGEKVQIDLSEMVYPGMIYFLRAIKQGYDKREEQNFVLCIDSMTIKIELILRYVCVKLERPTFRYWQEENSILAEEKSLSGLMQELDGFLKEEDKLLIRYLFNEKGGNNIRNRVAHGLFRPKEYEAGTATLCFMMICRLMRYKFDQ